MASRHARSLVALFIAATLTFLPGCTDGEEPDIPVAEPAVESVDEQAPSSPIAPAAAAEDAVSGLNEKTEESLGE